MGYVGNQTSNSYSSMDKQVITGNGGASYTLTHAVANAQEIEVFVNNVRQEAGVAYTVNGTALSMTGNVASTDDFYVIYQGKALQTVVPPDGSVSTGKLASGAVTSAKLDTNIDIAGTLDVTGVLTADSGIKLGTGTDALSYYEQGSWTPEYSPSSGSTTISYSTQDGTYTRIGNVVYFSIHLGTDSRSGGSGDVRVTLPIASKSGITQSGTIGLAYSWGSSIENSKWWISGGTALLQLSRGSNSAPAVPFSYLATGSGSNRLFINGFYLVA